MLRDIAVICVLAPSHPEHQGGGEAGGAREPPRAALQPSLAQSRRAATWPNPYGVRGNGEGHPIFQTLFGLFPKAKQPALDMGVRLAADPDLTCRVAM